MTTKIERAVAERDAMRFIAAALGLCFLVLLLLMGIIFIVDVIANTFTGGG
jgi:hypothetical protein